MRKFEWDEAKNPANMVKHGIAFEAVRSCWDGPMFSQPDTRFDYGELRSVGVALLGLVPVVVVYTERGETIRIISARRATRHEQKIFDAYLKISEGNG